MAKGGGVTAAETDKAQTSAQRVLDALSRLAEVASLPEVTTRILEVVENPCATAHDMHQIIKSDPALAAKVLKVVNSAFYGVPSQIASLERAIVMLGLSAVKNIALAASLSRLFRAEAISEHFAARDLWRHSVAVAVAARLIAAQGGRAPADEAFVAGLVHDLGLIALRQLYPLKTRNLVEQAMNQPTHFAKLEQELVGISHALIGAELATRWRFPALLRAAMAHHHQPERAPAEHAAVTRVVHAADVESCRARYGFWLSAGGAVLSTADLDAVGLTAEQMETLVAEMAQLVEEAEQVFSE